MARATSSLPVPLSPDDEHIDVLRGNAADGLAHVLHDRTAADNLIARLAFWEHRWDAHETGSVDCSLENLTQSLQIDWLGQIVKAPPFIASMADCVVPWAVINTTGRFGASWRSSTNRSRPERSGSCKSSTTTSGSRSRAN